MKVEVIKGVSHSVELNFGETSVCITPDEAENLIAQLRAVVPVPEDVQEAAEAYEDSLDYHEYMSQWPSVDFAAGMLAERERLMKDAVEIDTDITINRYTKQHILHINPTDEHIQHLPRGEYKAIIIKKEK